MEITTEKHPMKIPIPKTGIWMDLETMADLLDVKGKHRISKTRKLMIEAGLLMVFGKSVPVERVNLQMYENWTKGVLRKNLFEPD